MTPQEAYAKIINERPGFEVIKCMEYASLYVFHIVPKGMKINSDDKLKRPLNTMRSVDKETGVIKDFKPFFIPIDEFRNGKEVNWR